MQIFRFFLVLFVLLIHCCLFAQNNDNDSKCSMLINVCEYITWQNEAKLLKYKPFLIFIIGETPLALGLDKFYLQNIKNRRVLVKNVYALDKNLKKADLLIISEDAIDSLAIIRKKIDRYRTLIVTENNQNDTNGVQLSFSNQNNEIIIKIYEINLENSGFKVSTKLRAYNKVKIIK